MFDLNIVILSVVGAVAIIVYATWFFGHQLRVGQPKAKSFRQWLKSVFEALWGL